ncbi:uncharacterized protein LOC113880824 isoform X2 [Bos indicus x Bos taurus]|uniref:uncharacterized protein LOC113880824 isoform X2 n=1 Tax=Bos indicus x Bos taurus TaxID=30522 RepID=UPI000F7D43B8|nr:uncharacterized protein LOC113880824 isoform X2 [Bos indicus x Bos taurus]
MSKSAQRLLGRGNIRRPTTSAVRGAGSGSETGPTCFTTDAASASRRQPQERCLITGSRKGLVVPCTVRSHLLTDEETQTPRGEATCHGHPGTHVRGPGPCACQPRPGPLAHPPDPSEDPAEKRPGQPAVLRLQHTSTAEHLAPVERAGVTRLYTDSPKLAVGWCCSCVYF